MRLTVVFALALALQPSAASAQVPASEEDVSVVRAVLESRALPELIQNWEIHPEHAEVVISNRLEGCVLPHSRDETKRVNGALERLAAGATVPAEELEYRPPSLEQDLVVSETRIIPKELVHRCVMSGAAFLPAITLRSPVQTIIEDGAVITSEFRKEPRAWKRRHPLSVGVVTVGRPVYTRDHALAAVSYSRFRNGLGGAVMFCMLQKRGNGWDVLWQETLLIE
jgi:hypothetical protein